MIKDKEYNIIALMAILVPLAIAPGIFTNIFSTPKMVIILGGAFLLLAIYVFKKEIEFPVISTTGFVILIVFLNFISFLYTKNYHYTKYAVTLNVSCLVVFYFTSLYVQDRIGKILAIISAVGVVVSIITILQYIQSPLLPVWLDTGLKRTSTIGNSNFLGAYLLFPFFSLCGLIATEKTGKIKWVSVVGLIVVFTAIVFSLARASWIGLVAGIIAFAFLFSSVQKLNILKRIKLKYVLIWLVIVVSGAFLIPDRFYQDISGKVLQTSSFKKRAQFYQASLEVISGHHLFGTGLWSYKNQVYDAQAEQYKRAPDYILSGINKPKRVHSDVLEVFVDGGFVAWFILSAFLLTVMAHGWWLVSDKKAEKQTRVFMSACVSCMVAVLVDSIFFFPFRIESTLFMTLLMLGLIEGAYIYRYAEMGKFKSNMCFGIGSVLMLLCVFWFMGIKPIVAENHHRNFRVAKNKGKIEIAEQSILKAIEHDPTNTRYCVDYGVFALNYKKDFRTADKYIDKAITNFTGDNILSELYFKQSYIKLNLKDMIGAEEALEKTIYYNPHNDKAKQWLKIVHGVNNKNRGK